MSKTFVLCHGTWHAGWAWDEVCHLLCMQGHRACAPTLAGHGPGVSRLGVKHQDCVDSVVACIREHDFNDVILVGHSFGGPSSKEWRRSCENGLPGWCFWTLSF